MTTNNIQQPLRINNSKNYIFGIRHFFIVVLLMLILCDYTGRGYIFAPLLFAGLLLQRCFVNLLNAQAIWVLFFSVTFCGVGWLSDNDFFQSWGQHIQYLCLPFLCYLAGRLIVRSNRNEEIIIKLLFLLCLSLGFIAFISVYSHIMKDGFLGDNRSMSLIGLSDNIDVAATGINARLSMLLMLVGLFFVRSHSGIENRYKLIAVGLSLATIICSVRLGSRTGLVLAATSIIISFLFNFRQYSKVKMILSTSCLIGLGIFISYLVATQEDYFSFYMNRIGDEEFGTDTAGGRTQRWVYCISQIPSYPFGGIPGMAGDLAFYAHNLWLDLARLTGWLPFFILIGISISSIRETIKLIKNKRIGLFLRTVVLICLLGLFMQFSVEPILEGIPMLFVFFCLLYGMITQINQNASDTNTSHNNNR